jgi:hypothetical protein
MLNLVSRTMVRPFKFTSNSKTSLVEILVRTGEMLPLAKPSKAEKGLQEISTRDGLINPISLAPLLQKEELKMDTLAKQWVDGLRGLGKGSVGLSEGVLVVKEVKVVGWKSLRNIVLFRFRCGIFLVRRD